MANNSQQIIASGSGLIVGNTTNILQTINPIKEKFETDLLQDYNSSRDNTQELMEMGKAALTDVLTIASQGQHPRFFEAAAIMLKTLVETNMGFMDTQTKLYQIQKIKHDLGFESPPEQRENITFIGTTAELLKALNTKTKKVKTINIDDDIHEIE